MPQNLPAVLQEYGGLLSRIAAAYEADESLRDDLCQDIALALWRALPNWRGDASMKTFVAKVAHNRAASHVLVQTRRPMTSAISEDMPDPGRGPAAHTERVLDAVRLRNAVRSLPLSLRQPVTLALEDFSHKEIADTLGISADNVAVRLSRARQALKKLLSGRS